MACASVAVLQWSHGFSAMDTLRYDLAHTVYLLASMEPRLFSHGYTSFECFLSVSISASMEPRLFSHGYAGSAGRRRPAGVASMEPRLFSHGYATAPCCRSAPALSFNGATAFQPWIPPRPPPASFAPLGFNGATAFQPWIQREIRVTVTIPYRSRLRFQGSTFLSSYDCQCLPRNSTMFIMNVRGLSLQCA